MLHKQKAIFRSIPFSFCNIISFRHGPLNVTHVYVTYTLMKPFNEQTKWCYLSIYSKTNIRGKKATWTDSSNKPKKLFSAIENENLSYMAIAVYCLSLYTLLHSTLGQYTKPTISFLFAFKTNVKKKHIQHSLSQCT